MREFELSLERRRYEAAWNKHRYWSDPAFRLDRINRNRALRGRPLLASIEEVATRGPIC